MTVEMRQAGAEWLVEVHGEPIGVANSAVEALELAEYWAAKLGCVATWRVSAAEKSRKLPEALTRIFQRAYDDACRKLGIRLAPVNADDNKGLRKEIADALLCAVRLGECDAVALTAAAISAGKRYRHAPKR
jgi:hypothetical protein